MRVAELPTGELMVGRGAGTLQHPRAAFAPLVGVVHRADEVRGDPDEFPDTAVIYIGETTAKHFYTSHDLDALLDDHREAIEDAGHVIIDGVGGGWSNWEGRPEFSDWYVDVSNAEVLPDA